MAPFKAQNMSNNARVVASATGEDGEIGSAQYFQALAARAEPTVVMNPLLLKPEADTRSQVVLLGQVVPEITDVPWRERSEIVWPKIKQSLDTLMESNDVVVIEGAGSPAEINLHGSDIVNMRTAKHANARCLLVTDIDRGGAFAHLYGTWSLLPPDERQLIKGFVLNKFRGDASLLSPAPEMLQEMTGIPVVATLPMWWEHGLPEEDGVFDDRTRSRGVIARTIAVIAWPRISNLDEFQPLKNVPGVRLVWARTPGECEGADWIILPGSKATASDLAWLRSQNLDKVIQRHHAEGKAILGICGGLQMLGQRLSDPHGIDGNAEGLGLISLNTQFSAEKTVKKSTFRFGIVGGHWSSLSGMTASGYEIHHGQTAVAPEGRDVVEILPGVAWQNKAGNVFGCYLHGLFECPQVMQAVFGTAVPTLDSVFEGLADYLAHHFEVGTLDNLID